MTMTSAPDSTTDRVDRRLSVAPMMECTDRHFRYLVRLLSRRTLLYTEMVHANAVIHGDRERLLDFDPLEGPLAIQLGGSEPGELGRAAAIAAEWGYDEVNLNVGCPSDRVKSGRFGACLMAEPGRVADCVAAMREAGPLPVTVKTRIGIDDMDGYDVLAGFVERVAAAGCKSFAVHARKAWLNGLSPKANREVPPLRHDRVFRLKRDFPHLEVVINGGVRSLAEAATLLESVDGVMIGREAYANPHMLAAADGMIFGDDRPSPSRQDVLHAYLPYVRRRLAEGVRLQHISRHLLGLFSGMPGARRWRRHLSENAWREDAPAELLVEHLPMQDSVAA